VRFTQISEAEMLVNLLKSEGIDCYARDSFISEIYRGVDLGGVKVELLEKDRQRALEIMKDYGYKISNRNPDAQDSEIVELNSEPEFTTVSEDEGEPELSDASGTDEASEYSDISEEKLAEYKRNKAKLSRTMFIGCIVIALSLIGLIYLNKYFNG
jgi:hypothetical protein